MKVLVVDDDPVARRILRQIITVELEGEVVEAANGMVALDMVSREAPDVVILDLQMPGVDGVETLATLRAWRHTKDLPVLVLTSQTDEKIVRRCVALRVSGYLAKPLQPDVIRDRLTRLSATLVPKTATA